MIMMMMTTTMMMMTMTATTTTTTTTTSVASALCERADECGEDARRRKKTRARVCVCVCVWSECGDLIAEIFMRFAFKFLLSNFFRAFHAQNIIISR